MVTDWHARERCQVRGHVCHGLAVTQSGQGGHGSLELLNLEQMCDRNFCLQWQLKGGCWPGIETGGTLGCVPFVFLKQTISTNRPRSAVKS